MVLTDSEKTYTVDFRRVSQGFSLLFNLNADQAITAGQKLQLRLPFYDSGFIADSSSIICKLNDVAVPCIAFAGVDVFLINVQTTLPFGASF